MKGTHSLLSSGDHAIGSGLVAEGTGLASPASELTLEGQYVPGGGLSFATLAHQARL